MKRKHHRTQTLALLFSVMFSVAALASEKFVLSATNGTELILRIFELDQNQIKTVDSNVIETGEYFIDGIINTAVTFRKENALIFDVYYTSCQDDDLDCWWKKTVSLKRLDSHLQVRFEREFSIPVYDLSTIRLQKPSGVSLRLLIQKDQGGLEERRLDKDGTPQNAQKIAPRTRIRLPLDRALSEDGKMLVTLNGSGQFALQSLHADSPIINKTKAKFPVVALTLSGPVSRNSQSAGSLSGSYRFLFFETYHYFTDTEGSTSIKSRVMRQTIDDLTGEFIGSPKAFTGFKVVPYRPYGQSVAVTPGANVVFFSEFDPSCKKDLLWARVFDPQKETRIGPSQLLIGCSELSNKGSGISSIDVAQFEP